MTDSRDCEGIQILLAEGLDRELEPGERSRVEEHLAACPTCREMDAWLRGSPELIAATGPEGEADSLVAARVAERVQARIERVGRRRLLRTPPLWVAAAAVALMLGVLTQRGVERAGAPTLPSQTPRERRIEAFDRSAEEPAAGKDRVAAPAQKSMAREAEAEMPGAGAPSSAVESPPRADALARVAPSRPAPRLEAPASALGEDQRAPLGRVADSTATRRALAAGPPALLALAREPRLSGLSPALGDSLARAWSALLAADPPDSQRALLRAALRRLETGRE